MARKLFVGNLSFNTDENRLQEIFGAIGPVDSVNIVRDQMTGRARGFAFVEMQSEEGAESAIQKLNETDLDGRKIAVNEARPKTPGGGGGGGGRGGNRPGGGGGSRRREPRW
jgi:RNA recognition motif-containing protein